MSYSLNVEQLRFNNNGNQHKMNKIQAILPFTTHASKELKTNFYGLLGDVVRFICNVENKQAKKKSEIEIDERNPLIEEIKKDIEHDLSISTDLERFLENYLYNASGEMKISHPYLFNYMPAQDKEIHRKISRFVADILVANNSNISNIFLDKHTDNILDEIILNKLKLNFNNEKKVEYINKLPYISDMYCEDIMFLCNHRDYFLKYFPLITRFYAFNYVCQLLQKFHTFERADYNNPSPLYYALDWEGAIGKRRKAADETAGFKRVKERAKFLFVHMNTMAQLSCFEANFDGAHYKFLHYQEILDLLQQQSNEDQLKYLDSLNQWISEYSQLFKRVTAKEPSKSIEEGVRILFNCVKEGTAEQAVKRFGEYIEGLGGSDFLKVRGSSGTVLNLNHEMVLLLTAVCVKDQRMPLNQLFEEFEKRGVLVDRISKKLIVEMLDSQNFIDKKSDSGDAQYVKPIL